MTNDRTDRRIRRLADRQVTDRDALYRLLDEQLVGHLAVASDGSPLVVPMAYARVDDALLLHGSTGGGFALRAAETSAVVAFAVTALDGVVVARSLYDSSMNYRSAVAYGVLAPVDDPEAALDALGDRLIPGRSAEVRSNARREVAGTRVLRLALDDVVMKARAGGPSEHDDDGEDRTVWAGVVPMSVRWDEPRPSALTPVGTPVPISVAALRTSRAAGSTMDPTGRR